MQPAAAPAPAPLAHCPFRPSSLTPLHRPNRRLLPSHPPNPPPLTSSSPPGRPSPFPQVAPPIFLPQPGKHGRYRDGLAQKGVSFVCGGVFVWGVGGGWGGNSVGVPFRGRASACVIVQNCVLYRTVLHLGTAGMTVVLNSLGELTAYDSEGSLLWQVGSGGVGVGGGGGGGERAMPCQQQ
jgi:hypothetical protein